MKGKNIFTKAEIQQLRSLIQMRIYADRNEQKKIRNRMREIGFYGKDDFDITDLQPDDFERLIASGRIKIYDSSKDLNSDVTNDPPELLNINNVSPAKLPIQCDLNKFQKYLPLTDSENNIPNSPGNYIICLKNGSNLPAIGIEYKTQILNGLEVIYTGIASQSLRIRDYKTAFLWK